MADDKKLEKKINQGLQSAKDKLAEKLVHIAHKEAEKVEEEQSFNVVFTGVFTKDEKIVIAAMAKFYKQGQEATRRLLQSGRTTVIRTFPEKAPADKLAKMLNGIGLTCKVEMEVVRGEEKENTLLQKVAFKVAETDAPEVSIPKMSELGWKAWVAIGVVVVVLGGGGFWWYSKPPVVKGNSFASYQASVKKVIDKAPDDQKESLKAAIDLLTGAGFAYHEKNTFGGSEQVAANMAYGGIAGMNAKQIVAAAEVMLENKRNMFRKEITDTQAVIENEKTNMANLEPSNAELKKLVVSEARYTWSQGESPRIVFKLANNTSVTVGRIFFQGYLYDSKNNLLVTKDFMFTTGFGIKPASSRYVEIGTESGGPWSVDGGRENWSAWTLKVTVEQAEDMAGQSMGVDFRPARKRIEDAERHIREMEKQLVAIKLGTPAN